MKRSCAWLLWLFALWLPFPGSAGAQQGPPEVLAALADMNARLGTTYRLANLTNWYWEERDFPDASMGCPLRGVDYPPIETHGFLIMLTVGSQIFEYRAAYQSGSVVFCGIRPAAPAPPDTSNAPVIATGDWEYTAVTGDFNPALAWSPAGIAVADADGALRLYDPDDLDAAPARITLNQTATALDYGVNGATIAVIVGGADGALTRVEVEPTSFAALPMQTTDDRPVSAVSAGADQIAAGGDAALISLWNAADGSLITTVEAPTAITALDFSANGDRLVAGLRGGGYALYSPAGELLHLVESAPTGDAAALPTFARFNPDASLLAVASGNTVVVLAVTDPRAPEPLYTFVLDADAHALDFNHEGTLLAVAGGDPARPSAANSVIFLWDMATGGAFTTLRGHTNVVTGLAFSPNSPRLASISADGTLRVWDFSAALEE